jgi:aspartate ammonia-lyase
MLIRGMSVLGERCIDGITANEDYCRRQVEESPGLITILGSQLGYETCSEIAKESYKTGTSVYKLIIDKGLMSEMDLKQALNPEKMTNHM